MSPRVGWSPCYTWCQDSLKSLTNTLYLLGYQRPLLALLMITVLTTIPVVVLMEQNPRAGYWYQWVNHRYPSPLLELIASPVVRSNVVTLIKSLYHRMGVIMPIYMARQVFFTNFSHHPITLTQGLQNSPLPALNALLHTREDGSWISYIDHISSTKQYLLYIGLTLIVKAWWDRGFRAIRRILKQWLIRPHAGISWVGSLEYPPEDEEFTSTHYHDVKTLHQRYLGLDLLPGKARLDRYYQSASILIPCLDMLTVIHNVSSNLLPGLMIILPRIMANATAERALQAHAGTGFQHPSISTIMDSYGVRDSAYLRMLVTLLTAATVMVKAHDWAQSLGLLDRGLQTMSRADSTPLVGRLTRGRLSKIAWQIPQDGRGTLTIYPRDDAGALSHPTSPIHHTSSVPEYFQHLKGPLDPYHSYHSLTDASRIYPTAMGEAYDRVLSSTDRVISQYARQQGLDLNLAADQGRLTTSLMHSDFQHWYARHATAWSTAPADSWVRQMGLWETPLSQSALNRAYDELRWGPRVTSMLSQLNSLYYHWDWPAYAVAGCATILYGVHLMRRWSESVSQGRTTGGQDYLWYRSYHQSRYQAKVVNSGNLRVRIESGNPWQSILKGPWQRIYPLLLGQPDLTLRPGGVHGLLPAIKQWASGRLAVPSLVWLLTLCGQYTPIEVASISMKLESMGGIHWSQLWDHACRADVSIWMRLKEVLLDWIAVDLGTLLLMGYTAGVGLEGLMQVIGTIGP